MTFKIFFHISKFETQIIKYSIKLEIFVNNECHFLSFSRVYHFTVTVGGLFCIFGNRKSYKIKHLDKRSRAKKFECENLTGTEAPQMGVSVNPQAPVAQKVAD